LVIIIIIIIIVAGIQEIYSCRIQQFVKPGTARISQHEGRICGFRS